MAQPSPRLWAIRTVFRTMGAVAPTLAARWAETLFCTPPRRRDGDESFIDTAWAGSILESTYGLGHRALLRDPAVIDRAVEFLRQENPA